MKAVSPDRQPKIRRQATFPLLVYDLHTGMPMGQILDMSAKGMKLMSEEPVAVNRVYYCRMPLDYEINGCSEIFFDAECRWCKRSDETTWYNSGYTLRYPSPGSAEIVQKLTQAWMVGQAERLNARYIRPKTKKRNLLQRVFHT